MNVSSPEAIAALIAGMVAIVTALGTSLVTIFLSERRLKREHKLEFAAEAVARQLLLNDKWTWRRFDTITQTLGGFEDNELRRILVRAGAVRAINEDGDELWGLLSRNSIAESPIRVLREFACQGRPETLFPLIKDLPITPRFLRRGSKAKAK